MGLPIQESDTQHLDAACLTRMTSSRCYMLMLQAAVDQFGFLKLNCFFSD